MVSSNVDGGRDGSVDPEIVGWIYKPGVREAGGVLT